MPTRLEQSWQVWQRRCSAAAPRKGMAAVIALLTQELEDRPPAVERQRRRPEQPELPAVGQAVPRVVVVVRRRSRPRRPGKELNVQRIVPASWPRRPFRRLQIHKARDQRDVLQKGVAAAALALRLPWSVARVRGEHVLPVHSRSTNKSTARQPSRQCFRKPSSAWESVSQSRRRVSQLRNAFQVVLLSGRHEHLLESFSLSSQAVSQSRHDVSYGASSGGVSVAGGRLAKNSRSV